MFDKLKQLTTIAQGYKTYIVGAFFILYYLSTLVGINPPDPGSTPEQAGTVGLIIMILRSITSTPPANPLKLLGKGGSV